MTEIKGKACGREPRRWRSRALIAALAAAAALVGGAQALVPASAMAMTDENDDCTQMIGPNYWDDCADSGGQAGAGGIGTTGDPTGGGGASNPTAWNGGGLDPHIDPNTHDWKPSEGDLTEESQT